MYGLLLLQIKIEGGFELFCKFDPQSREIIYADEIMFDKFVERYLNLKVFL